MALVPGGELRRLREERGWSEEEAAKRIGYAERVRSGVRAISRWENGHTQNPRGKQYHEYVRLLTGVSQATLSDLSERLVVVEKAVAEILAMIREQQKTLHDGQWVVKIDREQLRELGEAFNGPPSERLLKRSDYHGEMVAVRVEPVDLVTREDVVAAPKAQNKSRLPRIVQDEHHQAEHG